MARTRRRTGGSGGQIALIVILSFVICAAIVGIGAFYFIAQRTYVPLEADTLCPKAGITSQTVVLLDTTDPLADVTKQEVLSRLGDASAGVPKGGLLQVWVLAADPAATKPALSLCNPGNGQDIDPVIGNPTLAKKRWGEKFEGPVEAAMNASVAGTEQHFSPILAGIQKIAAERLSSAALQQVPTTIIVVSDLLENTPYYSHFKDGLDFATFEAKAGARYLTQLHGAAVDFWMVQRARKDIDATALATFWLKWVDASGGKGQVERLMGM
jgi:hypothetical protein